MKKFTKGCLITALIIFVLGCLLCVIGGLLGGFRQLSNINNVKGIPFAFGRDANGDFHFGFFNDEWNDYDESVWNDYEENGWEAVQPDEDTEKTRLDLTADSLRNLEVDMGACGLYVMESEDDYVWIAVDGDHHKVYYTIEDGNTLRVENTYDHSEWPFNYWPFNWERDSLGNTAVYLFLPRDAVLDEINMDFGAGKIETAVLQAKDITLDCGAGEFNVDEVKADTIYLTVGAGQAIIHSLTAGDAELEAGAGELVVHNIDISGSLDLSIGMGNGTIDGTITGNMDAECDMGNLTMNLTGSEDDHAYTVDCSMGEVNIGNSSYAGMDSSREWGSGTSHFDIECSMGSVTVLFEE